MKQIERNAKTGFSQPVIIGRRLTVFNVVSNAFYRDSLLNYLNEFELSLEEVKAAIAYCKNRECKIMESPQDHYCDGCILRSISEGWTSIKEDFIESEGISMSKDGMTYFLGSVEELENEEFGVMGWLRAEEVEKRWFL